MKQTKGPRSGFNPKTASNTAMRPKPPVMTNANNPSADAQKQIVQPPQPFANKRGPVNLPVKAQFESRGTDGVGEGKYSKGTKVGAKALPSGGPVGQKRPINQSGQVFGKMGTSHPRKVGAQNLGKAKKNASFYGE